MIVECGTDIRILELLKIHLRWKFLFWPHRIVYWFSKCHYRVKDKHTVRFIYQLMHTLCLNQSKYSECESMFRRMVTPALTICKEMMNKRKNDEWKGNEEIFHF